MKSRSKTKHSDSYFDFSLSRKQLLKSKHSQAHVEMIISFVIFVGFLGSMFFFLNPFETRRISYTVLDMTETALINEWSDEYKTISVTFDKPQGGCFGVNNAVGFYGNLRARDASGNVNTGYAGGNLNVQSSVSSRYYKIFVSDSFSPTPITCEEVDPELNDYQFGASATKEAIFYGNIDQMVKEYNNDYEALQR